MQFGNRRNDVRFFTANGSITTTEEASVYLRDFDMFISVQLLEDSPAVLSPGTLCEDTGYSCELKENNYPHYPRMDKVIHCRSDTCVQIVAPGVVVDTRPRSDADAASGTPTADSFGRPRARSSRLASTIYRRIGGRSVGW